MDDESAEDWQEQPTESVGPSDTPSPPVFMERLAKYLASAGVASRRECEEYIRLGRVTVDGAMITEVGTKIDPQTADVRFDDERVKPEPKVYWWINKPKGVLSTSKDTHGRRTVLDLLPRTGKRLYCVGRLDEESTGLLLMTNDGEMALRLTHPRYGVAKTYVALVAGRVTPDAMAQMTKGVWLAEGKARVSHVKPLGTIGKASRLQIVLREGKNREIRRMFAKLGHKVMSLHRTAIGPLKIRRVKIGEARPASPEEIFELRRLARLVKGPDGAPVAQQPSKPNRKRPAKHPAKRAGVGGRSKLSARPAAAKPFRPKKGTKKAIGRQSKRRQGRSR